MFAALHIHYNYFEPLSSVPTFTRTMTHKANHLIRGVGLHKLQVDLLGSGHQLGRSCLLVFLTGEPEIQVLLTEL